MFAQVTPGGEAAMPNRQKRGPATESGTGSAPSAASMNARHPLFG
jgi:hypothetical protein